MPLRLYLLILAGSLLAAAGQVMFKVGASGREELAAFMNGWIVSGLLAYALGTVIWIYSLSKAPLTIVYPFTALTFVFVYLMGFYFLNEPAPFRALVGIVLILAGLFLIASA